MIFTARLASVLSKGTEASPMKESEVFCGHYREAIQTHANLFHTFGLPACCGYCVFLHWLFLLSIRKAAASGSLWELYHGGNSF